MKLWETWEYNIQTFIKAIEAIGGNVGGYLIHPAISNSVISEVEEELGLSLPDSFIKVVSEFTGGMEMNWSVPDEGELEVSIPEELKMIFAVHAHFSVSSGLMLYGIKGRCVNSKQRSHYPKLRKPITIGTRASTIRETQPIMGGCFSEFSSDAGVRLQLPPPHMKGQRYFQD